MRLRKPNLVHEQRVLVLALTAGLPAVATSLVLLWTGGFPARVQWTLGVLIVGAWLGFSFGVRDRVANPLRTLACATVSSC